MSAVDELMERKKNGFDFGILGRAILELAERVEALEDLAKRHIRLHIKEELSEPTPAPDLEAKISRAAHDLWTSSHNVRDVEAHLRVFAAELGVG